MNGPTGGMYKMKPVCPSLNSVELPTCMYKLPNLHGKVSPNVENMDPLEHLEYRQEEILSKLEDIQSRVNILATTYGVDLNSVAAGVPTGSCNAQAFGSIKDIVVYADPDSPPFYLFVLYSILKKNSRVMATTYTHSSLKSNIPQKLQAVFQNHKQEARWLQDLIISLIWKKDKFGPSLMVSPHVQTAIYGEANIARFIGRYLNLYDDTDLKQSALIDNALDMAHQLINGSNKESAAIIRTLNSTLGKNEYLTGYFSLADIVMWSAVHQSKQANDAPANVKKWLKACCANADFSLASSLI